MNRKFLILIGLILFIVSISAVSATEDLNQTIDDGAGDLVVSDDTLSVSLNDDEIGAKDDGTFTALQEKINSASSGSTIYLENDYYREESDPNKITINKALTINGNGHTIDVDGNYYGQSRVFYVTSSNVVLNDINFANAYTTGHYSEAGSYNGGAIYSERNLVLNNCMFTNCYIQDGYGAAIYSTADVTINSCTFTKNSGSSNSGYAASTVISAKNVIARDCSFYNNDYAVPIYSNNDLTVENSIFRNNTCGVSGWGKVIVKKSTFINNDAYPDNRGDGGAISSAGETKIEDCIFIGNNGYRGGAILLNGGSEIYNCKFINNTASFGGAVYLSSDSEVSLTNSNFTHNSAGVAGAIYLKGQNHVFHSLNFVENSASYGGALYYHECVNTIINECNFIKNHANSYGGAIGDFDYAFNYIDNCYFVNNSCWSGEMIDFDESLGLIYNKIDLTSKISNLKIEQNLSNLYSEGINIKDNILIVHGYYDGHFLEGTVTVDIAGKTFKNSLNDAGTVSFDLNGLSGGIHDATIYCSGESDKSTSKFTIPVPIISSTVLNVPDVTKNYGGPERLVATLTESGKPIGGANININLNGVDYPKTTDSNGQASMAINLPAGTYPATVTYKDISTTAKVTVNQLTTKTTLSSTKNSHNSVTLAATVSPSTATGNVVFNVNGKDYPASKVSDAKATYTLNNLAVGSYEAKATYNGDVNHKSSASGSVKFTVEDVKIDVSAPDLTKYYHGPEKFVVTVKENNVPVVGKDVTITLNGKPYTRTTDEKGQASMAINLNGGVYKVTSEFEGIKVDSTITVKSTVSGSDVTKIFRNGTQYYAKFVDTKGNLMKNTDVKFNINGIFYTRTTDDEGVAKMNINLPPKPEGYVITAENPNSTEKYTNVIKVLPSIVENYDLTKYYRNESKYTLRIIGDDGKPVGEGVVVKLNINGVFYERKTNASGYMSMNINLPPGKYTVTAEYNGLRASNTITVLSVLETNDLSMKYKDGSKFEAKILDGQGKPYVGQSVTFNINGIFYQKTTGDDGVARLTINLISGEYIITSTYNGLNAANKVTISS
ncbi:MAG: Ig-like domain repeat protein [Methanobrevibacter sp.]|nr:Ig-like domain repeat protein [Methanobrevibacter sp.]